ncbi:MAG: AbrB/MazE/SpoVT family DNA-binding domain-containing protein [Mycobacterium sp.]
MVKIAITSKRQATLPAALCEELGVGPGDALDVERRVVDGETVWVLRGMKLDWSWIGMGRRYAKGRSHKLSDVKRSIEWGWSRGDRT